MKKIKILFKVAFLTIMLSLFCIPAYAASGLQGYAAYRDGVLANIFWHAAIMESPSSADYMPVIHANMGMLVKYGSWSEFLNGKTFMGFYKPRTSISSSQRDLVVSNARELTTYSIGYNLAYQMDYYGNSGTYVYPYDVKSMRCDGVTEYCYEWSSIRIYGSNDKWDISKNDFWIRDHHSGTLIEPESQAKDYMYDV